MVFSSIQAYLDQSNWQQQLNQPIGIGGTTSGNPQFPPALQPPPPPPHGMGGGPGNPGSIRPGSMSDRARMANIPMPEAALKCPRCESTNTKFCYFNNYSLSQPRHFCKTCRRYWTRGGSLRNVPVGGGCRRNKRSKGRGSSSNSPVSGGGGDLQNSGSTSSISLTSSGANSRGSLLGMMPQLQLPPLRFITPLSQLTEFNPGESALNYGGLSGPSVVTTDQMNFHTMNISPLGGGYATEQWRMQAAQISSLAGLDLASNLYPFQSVNLEATNYVNEGGLIRPKNMISSSGLSTQMASVKMEDNNNNFNNQEVNLSRPFLGAQGNDYHQWATNTSSANWTDLSGFSSSSGTNPM